MVLGSWFGSAVRPGGEEGTAGQQGYEAAGHVVCALRKRREINAGSHMEFSFSLFILSGTLALGLVLATPRWLSSPPRLNVSANIIRDSPKACFLGDFQYSKAGRD